VSKSVPKLVSVKMTKARKIGPAID